MRLNDDLGACEQNHVLLTSIQTIKERRMNAAMRHENREPVYRLAGLTKIYGVPGKAASAVRRFGMGLIDRISPIRNRLMSEARGTSGELPLLLRGLPI